VQALRRDANAGGALQFLERRYALRLRLFVAHKLGPAMRTRHDPDEIINEAWWRAIRKIDQFEYRKKGSFLDWLRKQVHWVILDRCRHDEGREDLAALDPNDDSDAPRGDPAATGAGPATQIGRKDLRQRLVESLETVPETYREVLDLACLQSKSRTEIAEILNVKKNTVSQQLKRGLEHWRRVLGENPLKYL